VKQNKKPLIITMLLVSLFQMGMVALSPVVASITTAFPGTSQTVAQLAMTFLCLMLVIFALFSGAIAQRFGRRFMCAAGMLLCAVAGICGTFFTVGLWAVYLWSAFLGAGTGLFVPAVSSMMIDYLEDDERNKVAGIQTAFVNLGGMLLSFFSGILATQRWCNAYLVFLAAAPVLVLSLKCIPAEQNQEKVKAAAGQTKSRIPAIVWLAALQTFLFAILYFAFSTNVSLLISERALGGTSLSGTATSVFMLGGCLFGFIFNKVMHTCKGATPSVAFLLVAASYLLIYFTDSVGALMVGAFIGGGSLSLIFPYFLIAIAGKVDASVSVISSSLILSVGPNFGSFVSPMILTNISNAVFGPVVAARFLLAAIAAIVMAVLLFLLQLKKEG
jgi:predicted MFS family arabinose efflux permease